MKLRLSFLFAACAVGAMFMSAPAAHAAAGGSGPNVVPFTAVCDGVQTDTVINARANGVSAAHTGGGTFVVTAFGEVTDVFTAPDGTTHTNVNPPGTKGLGRNTREDIISCTFAFTIEFADGGRVDVSGTVFGFSPGGND